MCVPVYRRLANYEVLFSGSLVSDSTRPPGRPHARLPCPPPSPGVCSDSVIEFLADSVYLFLLFKAPPPHPPTTSFPFKEKRVWLTGSSPVNSFRSETLSGVNSFRSDLGFQGFPLLRSVDSHPLVSLPCLFPEDVGSPSPGPAGIPSVPLWPRPLVYHACLD